MASPTGRHRDRGLNHATAPAVLPATGLAVVVVAMAIASALGCKQPTPEPAVEREVSIEADSVDTPEAGGPEAGPEPREPELEVGVSGCSGLVADARGLVCLTRKPKPLFLWLDGYGDGVEVSLRFAGAPLAAKRVVDPDGVLLEVEPAGTRGTLELELGGQRWVIELAPVSEAYETVRKAAVAEWKAQDADAALTGIAGAGLEPGEQALLGCLAARIALAEGDVDRMLAVARDVAEAPTLSCVGKAALLVAYVQLYQRPDFNGAEASLRAAEAVEAVDLETRIGGAYMRAVLDHWLGRIDESLTGFERAARLARLVGDEDQYASALVMQAVALARLGRYAEAQGLAAEVEDRAAATSDAALALDLRASVAWIAVLRRDQDPSLPDPSTELRTMIAAYAARDDRRSLANRRLDLALTLVQNADLRGAAAELDRLDPGALDPDLLVWFELTAARVALARGRLGAAEAPLGRARVLAELNQDRELRWHVAIAEAELAHAKGDDDLAIERYRGASHLADELALAVAGTAGRSRFVTTHSRGDLALIELLLERGEAEDAMCTAMAARARHLRGLWVRLRPPLTGAAQRRYRELLSAHQQRKQTIATRLERSWELSTRELEALHQTLDVEGDRADELLAEATALLEDGAPVWSCARALPRRQGDAVLTMAPATTGRAREWTAMLAHRSSAGELVVETVTIELDMLDTADTVDAAAANMLEALSGTIAGSEMVRVVPIGAFVTVDFHRLWRDRETGTAQPDGPDPVFVYSLGLGSAAPGSGSKPVDPAKPARSRAAVVAGASNLAAVTSEVSVVGEQVTAWGWELVRGWSPTADAQPRLLHYAGHGWGGGALGWQSALELPELGRVSAAQIVAGQRSPELVVLGACSTGRLTADSIDGGMNLAAAFLLAGARLVIAPVDVVDDGVALALARGLYADAPAGAVIDERSLAAALARVQASDAGADDRSRAQSFDRWRAWTP